MESIESMNFDKLTHPDAVLSCWNDQSIDLYHFGNSPIEQAYLTAIDNVRCNTGAPNFFLADYIWRLEARVSKLETLILPNQ